MGNSARDTAEQAFSPPPRLTGGQLMRLSALWFALQFFWAGQQLAIMPDLIEEFTTQDTKGMLYGLLRSAGAIVVIATQLTVGFISDHTHSKLGRRRPFIIYGGLSGCVAIVLFMLAPSYWWLFAAYMLLELTVNTASVPFQSLLPDLVPKRQHARAGTLMGLLHMWGYLVCLGVILIAKFLVADKLLGYKVIMLPLFVILLLVFGIWTVLGVDEKGWAQTARDRIDGTVRTLRLLPGTLVRFAQTAPSLVGCILNDYRKVELRKHPNLVFLWLSRFTVWLGYAAFIQYAKWHIDSNLMWREWWDQLNLGLDADSQYAFGFVMASFVIGGMLGSQLATPLALKYGKKAVIAGGMIVAAIADLPFVFTSDVWVASACGIVIGIGWGGFISADWAFACTLIPKKKAGSYMGMWDISTLLPQVISPLIAGLIYTAVYAYSSTAGISLTAMFSGELPKDDTAAAAIAIRWVLVSLMVYFALALWLLRKVKEERPDAQLS